MEKWNIAPYDETTGNGLVRHVLIRYGYFTGEVMVCLILNGTKLPHEDELTEKLREIKGMTSITINVNKKKSNVILGEEIRILWGQGYITDKIGDISYQISPLSFYQVNPKQTQKLYAKALEYADLHGDELYGICTAESGRFLFSLRSRRNLFEVWKSFLRLSKMPMKTPA